MRRYTGVPSRTVQTSGNHAISTGQSPRGNAASMLTGHPSRTTDVADSLTPSDVQPLSLFMIQERIWVVNEKERFNQSAIDKFNQEMNEIIKGGAQDVPKRQRSNILFMFTCQSKKTIERTKVRFRRMMDALKSGSKPSSRVDVHDRRREVMADIGVSQVKRFMKDNRLAEMRKTAPHKIFSVIETVIFLC